MFESSFFPYCIKEWTNLSEEFWKIKSTFQFKTKILCFIRSKENSIFKIHDINGIKLLNRLRLHFSHLNEYKLRHNVRATIDPMCSSGLEPETTLHYLLRCNLYYDLRAELLNDICVLNPTLKDLSFHWPSLLTFNMAKNIECIYIYIYICMQHLNASVL